MYQRFLPLPLTLRIEVGEIRPLTKNLISAAQTKLNQGRAEGRFSHAGVGKIFDIYLCNMKNFNGKAINSPNTSLVGWFQTQT